MLYNILNGDMLARQVTSAAIAGEVIICRECFVEGPIAPIIDEEFWSARSIYIGQTYGEKPDGYTQKVRAELETIKGLPSNAEINLWFEDDLFCQTNLWLILYMLYAKGHEEGSIYRIFPVVANDADHWTGFGKSSAQQLTQALVQRVLLSHQDLALGHQLWQAYSTQNLQALLSLAQTSTPAFAYLPEVVQAHIDRVSTPDNLSRPERVVKELMEQGLSFNEVFRAFSVREGIYGFGDLQVKRVYDGLKEV